TRRAARMREYIGVMRRLWSEDTVSFHGEFVNFDLARSFPKPANGGRVPVIIGGESAAALTRAAEYGDGWYGFNLGPEEAAARIALLRSMLAGNGRSENNFEIIVAPFSKPATPDDSSKYHAAGVNELVIVASPPEKAADIAAWIESLGRPWVESAQKLG
ncbi:MAG: LLM class flavin-dependent oxidoreductase, partial [Candidatus Binataceae bacterium]